MKALLFYLGYSIFWLITLLPIRVLYLFSDFLYLLAYHLIRYRRKTVFSNMRESFPDKTPKELKRIARAFYHQLMDYFVEWMYAIHMGGEELEMRMKYKNPEVLQEYFEKGKSIMLLLSHYGNWEWTSRVCQYSKHVTLAVYKPLENRYSDSLFLNLRSKFGIVGVPMESTLRSIIEHHKAHRKVIVLTLGDQRPQWRSVKHWTQFLNQDTPVITGPEKIARKFDMVPLFFAINKVKRGYYEAELKVLCEDPKSVEQFEITMKYMNFLENIIREKPELYLWTHKRWKYQKEHFKNQVDIVL